jgi:branched-chain amino acid transport system substrate-binding protein
VGTTEGRGSGEDVTYSDSSSWTGEQRDVAAPTIATPSSPAVPPWSPPPTPPYGALPPGASDDHGGRRTVLVAGGLVAVLAAVSGSIVYLSQREMGTGSGQSAINATAGVVPPATGSTAAAGLVGRGSGAGPGSVSGAAAASASLTVALGATSGAVNGGAGAVAPPVAPALVAAKSVVIATDLPRQGVFRAASLEANRAIDLYLRQIGHAVGGYTVTLRTYDNSTAARGSWDDAACSRNARRHLAHRDEVAVIGPYNSGCAKTEVPVLSSAPSGGPLMISHANTNPGLTVPWDAGEPAKHYPSGVRDYARVVPTDDHEGTAAALYAARTLKVRRCAVLDDQLTYGRGLARAFVAQAQRSKLTVVEHDAWDPRATSYRSLFLKLQAAEVDCVYLGGIADSNGAQLLQDKVAVLGPNSQVAVLAGDGFSGFPDIDALPAAAGMYLTFSGVSAPAILKRSATARAFAAAYTKKYGKITNPCTYYALAALQVVLEALKGSDGTAAGVRVKVLSGAGVSLGAKQNVLGTVLTINPRTGDVKVAEVSVLRIQGGVERPVTTLIAP